VAAATISVGQPQAALSISTTTGYLDSPLALATKGGSGAGAVTYTVTNGTATGCTITAGALSATIAGTCNVTATKAAESPYAAATTTATITISSAPRALRLAGILTIGRKATVTISGYNFSGRPRAISNVAGFSALVTRDTGKLLTLTITVKASATKPGVKTMTLIFANGKRASFKYSLH
jgi:ribosomal protein S11